MLSMLRHFLFCCLSFCAATMASAGTVSATLIEQATVEGGLVRFADLARLNCSDTAECARLESLQLGSSPRIGELRTLTRTQLVTALRQAGYGPAAQIAWQGATAAQLRTRGQLLDVRLLGEVALDALRSRYVQDQPVLAVQDVPTGIEVPLGAVAAVARPVPGRLKSQQTVTVDVNVDGRFYRSVAVSITAQAMRDGWFARQDMAAGAAVACVLFERRQIDVARVPNLPVAPDCNGTQRLSRALRAGELLDELAARTAPAIALGDRVPLQVEQGAVRLQTVAVALADGDVGSVIQVRPVAGTEPVKARVLGRGQIVLIGMQ
ncbi:flagella basal body P-ring formation protein FlgA [Andreprevotia lacus DSM 23236]|jgi:flagella basal body P-ring formation protein FlgA|uniref:Flagella basal body P-ring formation protein FlgA n=1 Tax=Andreprevotia lacus DSM 23236 TaxID=1121001 RepID=A0A1W1XVZ7_9NEIS|nr:flagellar basal body P-ring formation chaperone FlgA [Andreprevotia lacus]SMC27698.1 flagella basal body P-ring formation protein FlgA [Andreprevotia lacus DSM 23236]